jgi:hypothetical protein
MFNKWIQFQIQISRSTKLCELLNAVPKHLRARLDENKTAQPKTSLLHASSTASTIIQKEIPCSRVVPNLYRDQNGNLISLV